MTISVLRSSQGIEPNPEGGNALQGQTIVLGTNSGRAVQQERLSLCLSIAFGIRESIWVGKSNPICRSE